MKKNKTNKVKKDSIINTPKKELIEEKNQTIEFKNQTIERLEKTTE